jgi:ectoine hydroxylase-related dioxygenase (phytanoyl-CoA dioxygenase family)
MSSQCATAPFKSTHPSTMEIFDQPTAIPPRAFSVDQNPSVEDLKKLCSQNTPTELYRLSTAVERNIPVYDLSTLDLSDEKLVPALQAEWNHILLSGPGIIVLRHMFNDKALLEHVNKVFQAIIDRESKSSCKGDHFASKGQSDRIWNSFSKHCLESPETFVEYYSNPWLALISDAWLGPGYQTTAQVNQIRPGGAPQNVHRDYHLGFQTAEQCARYPTAMHIASQLLTLQGAVAHGYISVESGSTRLLPFSQMYREGFMAWRLPEFIEFFEKNYVALPLGMGDGLFFNPALFHAAGDNRTTDFVRKVNLLQISSAFGETMETVDSLPLIEKCWDLLTQKYKREGLSREVIALVNSAAKGYPFPTNLDKRVPSPGGLAPESEQQALFLALKENWDKERVCCVVLQISEDSKS